MPADEHRNGVGIHGTAQEYSIGTRASHGCLRMRVRDVSDLYPRVPVGTPVLIAQHGVARRRVGRITRVNSPTSKRLR